MYFHNVHCKIIEIRDEFIWWQSARNVYEEWNVSICSITAPLGAKRLIKCPWNGAYSECVVLPHCYYCFYTNWQYECCSSNLLDTSMPFQTIWLPFFIFWCISELFCDCLPFFKKLKFSLKKDGFMGNNTEHIWLWQSTWESIWRVSYIGIKCNIIVHVISVGYPVSSVRARGLFRTLWDIITCIL